MTQKLFAYTSPVPKSEDGKLFSGIWIRWRALSAAERLICTTIALIPVWWFLGITQFIPILLLLGIVLYDWWHKGEIRLKRPTALVIALFAFFAYDYINGLLVSFDIHPFVAAPVEAVEDATSFNLAKSLVKSSFGFSTPFLAWYIQSKNVRVRLEVVAWACTLCAIQMLLCWLVLQYVFPELLVNPPPSVYGSLKGIEEEYEHGLGAGNYLRFKDENEDRFVFFFGHFQICTTFLGFVSLLALDLKKRFWSFSLLGACIFLTSLTGSRTMLLVIPVVLVFRFLLIAFKAKGIWLLFAFIAIISFTTLSLPPITNQIFNTFTDGASAVANARPGSTEARTKIYTETLEKIPDRLFFGHVVLGEDATEGPTEFLYGEGFPIGSHSFILGGLLYRQGVVGSAIFLTFWLLLIAWLYNTRSGRPLCWSQILLLFTLIACVTDRHIYMDFGILLCMAIRAPLIQSSRRNILWQNS